jgi:hypothetical protein
MYALQPITQVFLHDDPVKLRLTVEDLATDITEVIETTPEHPFYVPEQGFVSAGDLKPGDAISRGTAGTLSVVRLIPGQSGTSDVLGVKNLTFERRPFLAYNLEIGSDHTFFVGAIRAWVHNGCGPKFPVAKQQVLEKVGEMKAAMTPEEKKRTTFSAAHVTTAEGNDEMWVAGAGKTGNIPKRVRGDAVKIVSPAKKPDKFGMESINDAEMHLNRFAKRKRATINAIGATRDVCTFCQLRSPDLPFVTPLKPLEKGK